MISVPEVVLAGVSEYEPAPNHNSNFMIQNISMIPIQLEMSIPIYNFKNLNVHTKLIFETALFLQPVMAHDSVVPKPSFSYDKHS